MCIIAIKSKGVNPPSKEILKNMFDANPDGAGIAYNFNGTLHIIKGLMTFEEFWDECKIIPKESGAIYHTRIETSGGICKELTHPFILDEDILQQRKTYISTSKGEAVAHNGVFNEFTHKNLNNDTTQFISEYLSPLKKLKDLTSNSILDDDLDRIINKLCSYSNKLTIINQDGDIKHYGDGWILDNGIYYSNSTYQDKRYNYNRLFDRTYLDCLSWDNTFKRYKIRNLNERIKYLLTHDNDFKLAYERWHNYMDDEELLESYENNWI